MKILYHHRTKAKEGQFVHIEEMLRAFRDRGHEVVVVGPHEGDHDKFGSKSLSVTLLRRFMPRPLSELAEFCYSILAFFKLRKAYLAHRPDVIYERYSLFLLAGCLFARRYGVPFLLEINAPLYAERSADGGLALKAFARWTERVAWKSADLALPVTQVLAGDVREAGVPAERIHVIHNGINEQRFSGEDDGTVRRRELGLDGRLILGFVGFAKAWHGLDQVVDVLARDGEKHNLHLLVVGDGDVLSALRQKAEAMGVGRRVSITGVVPRESVAAYVATFDIALQPRVTSYASPLKVFEYLAFGKPIIAPDQPNIREILAHENQALLFDPQDCDAFGRAILRLCEDPALRERLGENARRTIAERGFTWAGNVVRIERLISRHRGTRASLAQKTSAPHLDIAAPSTRPSAD
ncbi:glycosyltransferase family 4 protein [Aureimonas populi]|uniref:Glycosyltransferase family 4 protein n=1 Tax=Aureimonas populi TaxID=1701758 RepID=A0ABW5CL86_9HYPH|nr:glycosyltransferase family 4 protein [Aureimonas populi]